MYNWFTDSIFYSFDFLLMRWANQKTARCLTTTTGDLEFMGNIFCFVLGFCWNLSSLFNEKSLYCLEMRCDLFVCQRWVRGGSEEQAWKKWALTDSQISKLDAFSAKVNLFSLPHSVSLWFIYSIYVYIYIFFFNFRFSVKTKTKNDTDKQK